MYGSTGSTIRLSHSNVVGNKASTGVRRPAFAPIGLLLLPWSMAAERPGE